MLAVTTALASTLWAGASLAQTQPTPPIYYTLDGNGVDLVTGELHTTTTEVVIGQPGAGGMSYGRVALDVVNVGVDVGWRDLAVGGINCGGMGACLVSIGGSSEAFSLGSEGFTPLANNGSTLKIVTGGYDYQSSNGIAAHFVHVPEGISNPYTADAALVSSITQPNGEKTTYHYTTVGTVQRLQAITNNFGYQIHYKYDGATPTAVERVMGINMAEVYCAPLAANCDHLDHNYWPSVTYTLAIDPNGGFIETAVDQGSRHTVYHLDVNGQLDAIRLPGETINQISVARNTAGTVGVAVGPAGTWTYTPPTAALGGTEIVATGPANQLTTVLSPSGQGQPSQVRRQLSPGVEVTQAFQYTNGRVTQVTNPDGGYTTFTYDGRGNVTNTVITSRPIAGQPLTTISTSATYPTSCTSTPAICDKPLTTTDGRGAVTSYQWNATTGLLESVTQPIPQVGLVAPQTRIAYGTFNANYLVAPGTPATDPNGVVLPIYASACATGAGQSPGVPASCLSAPNLADETRTTIIYDVAGTTNLLPVTTLTQAGDSSVSTQTSMLFDDRGDIVEVDGPLANDVTRNIYDANRQLIGIIGPDPDGSGPLLHRARRFNHLQRGLVQKVEVGTTTGYTDLNWAAFATLQYQEIKYDDYGRPFKNWQVGTPNSPILTMQQVEYDAAGRPECIATRMNPSEYGATTPVPACTHTALSANGPDRIVKTSYDPLGRPISSTSGWGSSLAITELVTYSNDGLPLTLTDGRLNVSSMTYDGFNRLERINYPNRSGTGTSSSDYQAYAYDPNSNVTSIRTRGGETIAAVYDALNRQIVADPASASTPNSAFAYDNFSRLTVSSSGGVTVANVYDALSRQVSQISAEAPPSTFSTAVNSTYNAAGQRTSLTWPDAFWVSYEYDDYGALAGVKEYGSTVLASHFYDDWGRRTATFRGSGAVTAYSYDGISRLTSLAQDVSTPGGDVTYSFSYLPTSQILTRTVSNTGYLNSPSTSVTGYANNGLNQVTSAGGAAIGYDGSGGDPSAGNVVSALGSTYGYDVYNRLTTANSQPYSYDPQGRLYNEAGATRFVYDGLQLIAEYNTSGAVTRRHVPGAGLDDITTSYDASGVRLWPLTDERGSVTALTNVSGALTYINRYDEYGVPQSNDGRFQYTGQPWLPGANVYHYRARQYAPQLGRFLQTDPIGYTAGANLYAYVGGDPVNRIDPLGLEWVTFSITNCVKISVVGYPDETSCSTKEHNVFLPDGAATSGFNSYLITGVVPRIGTIPTVQLPDIPVVVPRRPEYCSNGLYRVGRFIDRLSGGGKSIGMAAMGGGALLTLTGIGAEAGVPILAAGGVIYGGSIAVSTIGNGLMYLGGGDRGRAGASLLSVPLSGLSPITMAVADQAVSAAINSQMPDPCG